MAEGLFQLARSDLDAVVKNDPAAKGYLDAAINHAPFHGILVYRVAHKLHEAGMPLLPRMICNIARVWSGAEIHPGACIGKGFFLDHGVGTVIGETSSIGDNCVMFHNVTLGGTGKHSGKRHPTVGDNALIGTGATILGPVRVGNNVKIGAGTFIIMRDIPDNCTVVGVPGRIVKLDGKRVNLEPKRMKPQ